MKYLFIIQGEGRGHMTQALSLAEMLRKYGHEITRVIVGKSERRIIPEFFLQKIGSEVIQLASPNFITDKDQKSVKPFRTIVYSLLKAPKFSASIKAIDGVVQEDDPDVILNFYDFLGGLYYFAKRPRAKLICIGHQYLLGHPEFTFPKKRRLDKISLLIGNKIASLGASKLLALSFQPFDNHPKKKLIVVPPLLREEAKVTKTSNKDHFLIYMVNPGYSADVYKFHEQHPKQKLHVFWDKKDAQNPLKVDENLTFHQLNDELFIELMASAKGYVTTAGFESVCEAMYLGKPVLMVPVEGHYEQACNALDGSKAGAGIGSDTFDISKLHDYIPTHKNVKQKFQFWANQAEEYFIRNLA